MRPWSMASAVPRSAAENGRPGGGGGRDTFKRRARECPRVPRGPDPRREAKPAHEVPALLREGAARYNAREFWHAHEAWEEAWHALRAAGRGDEAAYVRGIILVAAALENATRGREEGFKRQFAEGLHALKTHPAARAPLGIVDAAAWEDALVVLYAEACRRRDWTFWNGSGWTAPILRLG